MLHCYSLDQLAHKAECDDNELALCILDCIDDEIQTALEALEPNDADYSYDIFNAVEAIQELQAADWYKVEDSDKDKIKYMVRGLHEDTNPHNNNLVLSRYKGLDNWTLTVNGGEYGEAIESVSFYSKGFKDAQTRGVAWLVDKIKMGFELNF